jgi:hypothetical protein
MAVVPDGFVRVEYLCAIYLRLLAAAVNRENVLLLFFLGRIASA